MNTTTGLFRPTKPMGWWERRDILGGQDEVAGGTWLASSRQGRVAFVTNVLEQHSLPEAKSRGHLPILFLESQKSPKEFAEELVKEASQYNGFNLIVVDLVTKSMVYTTNRPKGEPILIQEIRPGIHVLSNAKLNTPWPKVKRLATNFKLQIGLNGAGEIPVGEMVKKLMRDSEKADESELPHICPTEWELSLSSIFVQVETPFGRYGTRSSTALTLKANGETSFYETYVERGNVWKEHSLSYNIHN